MLLDPIRERRLAKHIHPEPNSGCWLWLGIWNSDGYGQFRVAEDRKVYSHRLVYERYRGPIPADLQLDHLCRNHACCNPAHLEAVTSTENKRRGFAPSALNARKTHCVRGHEFTPENIYSSGPERMNRACATCERSRSKLVMRRIRARRKNAALAE